MSLIEEQLIMVLFIYATVPVQGRQNLEYPDYCSSSKCKKAPKIIKKIDQTTKNPEHEPVIGLKIVPKEVDHERRCMMLNMVDIGVKHIDIANYYRMPKTSVSSIRRSGRVEKQEETRGRKNKLPYRVTRSLLEVMEKLGFEPAKKIESTFNQFALILTSIRTVRKTLKENGIQNYTAMSKPYLSLRNTKESLQCATIHKNRTTISVEKLCSLTNHRLQCCKSY